MDDVVGDPTPVGGEPSHVVLSVARPVICQERQTSALSPPHSIYGSVNGDGEPV
jgi:hypothetical protein